MQTSIHPVQLIFSIFAAALLMKGCVSAFDREMAIQEELGRQYYEETLRLQAENPNP